MFCTKHFSHLRNINNGCNALNASLCRSAIRLYSKDKDDCCKENPQTEGRTVQAWPKETEPCAPRWRAECPTGPQPPNYDPYRIKEPEVVVPPCPPPNVKAPPAEDILNVELDRVNGPLHVNSNELQSWVAIVHPSHSIKTTNPLERHSFSERLGYHGKNKYKYAFHEPWNPIDRMSLLQEAEKEEEELSPK